jgi:hypothetical protein
MSPSVSEVNQVPNFSLFPPIKGAIQLEITDRDSQEEDISFGKQDVKKEQEFSQQ